MLKRVAVRYETVFFCGFFSSSRDIAIRDVCTYPIGTTKEGGRGERQGLLQTCGKLALRFKRLFPEFSTTSCAFPKLCIICTPH